MNQNAGTPMSFNQRLVNETAFQMARAMLGLLQNLLRPEDHRIAFEWLYDTCKDGLELYDVQRGRMQERLKPKPELKVKP